MSTTWAGTASNQTITYQALQDALDTGVLARQSTFIPTNNQNKCINYIDSSTYAIVPSATSDQNLRLKTKSFYVSSTYGISIAGRRDGSAITVFGSLNGGGGATMPIPGSTCSVFGQFSYGTAGTITLFITAGTFGGQRYKFYLTDAGATCPSSGTQYSDYSITNPITKNYNLFVVPVWTGTAYVPI